MYYQKIRLDLTGAKSQKISSIEKIVKNKWCRFRFLYDVKRYNISLKNEVTYENIHSLLDFYKKNPSEENFESVKSTMLCYLK